MPARRIALLLGLALLSPTLVAADDPCPPCLPANETRDQLVKRLRALPKKLLQQKKTDAEIVEALFRAALGRKPTDEQKKRATAYLAKQPRREDAVHDVLWAVVNSTEFMKVHKIKLEEALALGQRILKK